MRHLARATTLLALGLCFPVHAAETPSISDAVAAVEEVDALRRRLAPAALATPQVTEATFAQVCKPVGARAKEIAQEKGWQFVQMAKKYRNPSHKADAEAERAIERFNAEPTLEGFWLRSEKDGKPVFRYFRRITVEESCLACHGNKADRPAFITQKYPDDKAFGFKKSDLRGVYSVSGPIR